MAASRSMLEALLARVQQRASEPRTSAPESQRLDAAPGSSPRDPAPSSEEARTLPPPPEELADEDVEEYDDDLIEIIDDAEVIPREVAAARAIDARGLTPSHERRASSNGVHAGGPGAPASVPASGPASVRSARPAAAPQEPLRAESVAPRPVAASEVAQVRGGRRELRASSFVELLDASLQLGG